MRKGFTIIEVLIVVSIVGIMASIAIPSLKRAQAQAEAAESGEDLSYAGRIFQGTHALKPFGESLFLTLIPSNKTQVTFCWQLEDKTYAVNTIYIEQIRFEFNDNYGFEPTVRFKWKPTQDSHPIQDLVEEYVIYMVVSCQEKDWELLALK